VIGLWSGLDAVVEELWLTLKHSVLEPSPDDV
jgi:hypothetical protein